VNNLHRAISYAFAVLLIAGITSQAIAGDKKINIKDVPAAALKAFKAAFPKVTVNAYIEETEDDNTFFEFETVEGTTKRDILYKSDGTLVEVEEILTPATVPTEIAKVITDDMPKAKIVGGEKTTKDTDVTYEMNFTVGKRTGKVVLSADGKIIKKEMKKAKKEKKEEKEEKQEKDSK
jgi:hypothetical protein